MIEIMKASAGSGKTFNLARKYITLLFKKQDRYAYRHILAVTFTNKATDEMKRRIIKELHILACSPEKSGYLKYFMVDGLPEAAHDGIDESDLVRELPGKPGQKITLKALSGSAGTLLCDILHDYSAFAVSTIDRFFQQTLKAFSREIGQFASYQVELDKNSLVAESVDRLLDALTESDTGLLKWLTDSVMEEIEAGGRYNLEKTLEAMACRLKSDEHRAMVEDLGIDEEKTYSKENLSSIRKACTGTIKDFTESVKSAAEAALNVLQEAGIEPEKSNRGFMKALYGYQSATVTERIDAPTDSFMTKAADCEQWFPKSRANACLPKVYPALERPLNAFCSRFGLPFKAYNTARILRNQLYSLGIAGELYKEFNALMKEKNVLSIDDSNTILKNIIDGSDAPFIYEKTGVRFENFLLDEFQDTSRIQWDNFRPLLHNSEAQGFDSLIVGDVKQSIYRWRGSDWNLFHHELQDEFPGCRNTGLDTNFRSLGGIVAFNNAFFPLASGLLDAQYRSVAGDQEGDTIGAIYEGVEQKAGRSSSGQGFVRMVFCSRDSENGMVLGTVRELEGKGIPRGDIAVLVRNNSSGADIAAYLIDNGIDVITDDSLKVKSSVTVRRIVSLLSYMENPSDTVSGYLARKLQIESFGDYRSLSGLCEDLIRKVRAADPESFESEILYIQSFMDYVQDYAVSEGNDLHGFLRAWADAEPNISSPSVSDAVRIMTVHKSKGLDFPYVIFPYAENITFYKSGNHWCSPDLAGTGLEGKAEGLYDVRLSSGSVQTLFDADYRKELKLQYVDNINTAYVALTRASEGMVIIASGPSASFLKRMETGGEPSFSDFSQMLYWFAESQDALELSRTETEEDTVLFSMGRIEPAEKKQESSGVISVPSGYPSWPLDGNPGDASSPEEISGLTVGERGRLKFSTDAAGFFSDDGRAGVSASHRLKGIVLHDILSRVTLPEDLQQAVDTAVYDGDMDEPESEEAYSLLSDRIAGAVGRGWFPKDPSKVGTEVTLIDTDGSVYRPDRVIEDGDSAVIIDYKFGEPRRSYERQVAGYASIYRRMGFSNVSAFLWYVFTDEVVLCGK